MLRKLLFILSAAFVLSSCSSTALDGDWDPMKWNAEQKLTSDNGAYIIPADGETITFVCKNYSKPWMSEANVNGKYFFPDYEANDYKSVTGDWFAASIQDNRLSVTFTENTAAERSVAITVTAGDIFYTFKFRQKASSH